MRRGLHEQPPLSRRGLPPHASHGHAVVPVVDFLLGDQDGSVQGSVLLRDLISGHPEVVGYTADTLASTGHFASLRGGKGLCHTAAADSGGSLAGWCSLMGRLHIAALALALQVQQTGSLGLGCSGDLHEIAPDDSSPFGAAFARAFTRLLSRPVLLVELRTEVSNVSALKPDRPPFPLPPLLVAQRLELRFELSMMVHILADLRVLGGGVPLGPRVAVVRSNPALA